MYIIVYNLYGRDQMDYALSNVKLISQRNVKRFESCLMLSNQRSRRTLIYLDATRNVRWLAERARTLTCGSNSGANPHGGFRTKQPRYAVGHWLLPFDPSRSIHEREPSDEYRESSSNARIQRRLQYAA